MEKSIDNMAPGQVQLMIFVCMTGCFAYNFFWMMRFVDNAIWFSLPMSTLVVIPLIIWFLNLVRRMPKHSVFDILDAGVGKIVSKLIILIYYSIHIVLTTALLNLFCQTLKIYFLNNTPFWFIALVILLTCALIANSDIKVLAMFCSAMYIVVLINFFTGYTFGMMESFKVSNLLPVFDTTYQKFITAIIFGTGNACECILMLMVLTTSIPSSKKWNSTVVNGVILATLTYISGFILFLGVFPKEALVGIAGSGVVPATLLHVGEFLRGFEMFLLGAYQITAVSKGVISLYCMQQVSIRFCGFSKTKLFLGIAALIIYIPTLWINSFYKAYLLSVFVYQYVLLPFSVFVLLIASLSSFIITRRKKAVRAS